MPHLRARQVAVACASLLLITAYSFGATRPLPETVNVVQFPTRGDAGYLDLEAVKSMLPGAARYWIASCFEVFDGSTALPKPDVGETRLSLSSDRSFDSYSDAVTRLGGEDLPAGENVFWDQVWLDI